MPFSTYLRNAWLNALDGVAFSVTTVYVSAHTADPGDTGTAEVVGGSYARQAVTLGTAAAGSITASNQPEIPIPGGTTVTHVGYWDAASNGNFLGSDPVTNETFASDGTYRLTSQSFSLT